MKRKLATQATIPLEPLTDDTYSMFKTEYGLTRKEVDIARLLGASLTIKGASSYLGISSSTVSKHVESIHRKLCIHSVIKMVAWCIYYNLIPNYNPTYQTITVPKLGETKAFKIL